MLLRAADLEEQREREKKSQKYSQLIYVLINNVQSNEKKNVEVTGAKSACVNNKSSCLATQRNATQVIIIICPRSVQFHSAVSTHFNYFILII